MKLYVNVENGKAYTEVSRNKYINSLANIEGAFENWLDDNFLASEVLGENSFDLHAEYMQELTAEFEAEYAPIEVELV